MANEEIARQHFDIFSLLQPTIFPIYQSGSQCYNTQNNTLNLTYLEPTPFTPRKGDSRKTGT